VIELLGRVVRALESYEEAVEAARTGDHSIGKKERIQ
jgi:hypothetical protein